MSEADSSRPRPAARRLWNATPEARLEFFREKYGPDECWPFTGPHNENGYGQLTVSKNPIRKVPAHRFAWESENGPVPGGLELDHLCRNRVCCNPAHLEPVTHQENMRRWAATITHCPQGHPYDNENTYVNPTNGGRLCRACQREHKRAYKARKRAERK